MKNKHIVPISFGPESQFPVQPIQILPMDEQTKGLLFIANMQLHVEQTELWTRNVMDKAVRFPDLLSRHERVLVQEETTRHQKSMRKSAHALMALQKIRAGSDE